MYNIKKNEGMLKYVIKYSTFEDRKGNSLGDTRDMFIL